MLAPEAVAGFPGMIVNYSNPAAGSKPMAHGNAGVASEVDAAERTAEPHEGLLRVRVRELPRAAMFVPGHGRRRNPAYLDCAMHGH
jgi:hypothetical protein